MSLHRTPKGLYVLWHPDSPGMRVTIVPGLLRRLRIRRSPFATFGEIKKAERLKYVEKDYTRSIYTRPWSYPVGSENRFHHSPSFDARMWYDETASRDAKQRSERFP